MPSNLTDTDANAIQDLTDQETDRLQAHHEAIKIAESQIAQGRTWYWIAEVADRLGQIAGSLNQRRKLPSSME